MPRVEPRQLSGSERFRYRLSALGVSALLLLCRVLPIRWVVAFGGWLGERFCRYDHKRRGMAMRNLKLAYSKEFSRPEQVGMVRAMYRHFGKVAAEYLILLARNDMRPYSRWIEIENLETAREALKKYGTAIFVTCHGGHFELLGAAVSEQLTPLIAVMKPFENPYLDAMFIRLREKLGMKITLKFPALRTVLRELRDGNSVALLCDQRRRKRALIVDFFGQPAATVDTPAVLALRFGIPVVPSFSWRSGAALEYRGYTDTPILPDPEAPRDAEVTRITQEINDSIERFVRAHPEQWNWTQPRWMISNRMRRRARVRKASD